MNERTYNAVWVGTFERVNGMTVVYTIEVKGTLDAIRNALNYFIAKKRGLKFLFGEFESLREQKEDKNAKPDELTR